MTTSNSNRKFIRSLLPILCSLFLASPLAAAQEPPAEGDSESGWDVVGWNLNFSLYTIHFDPDPEHVNNQKLIAPEIVFRNRYLVGVAVFDNSFGQNSQYVYIGRTWDLFGSDHWYFKLTGGLLHGYKEPYDDKIPLNGLGVAPAIVPTLGVRYKRVMLEANLGGLAAMTFTAGIRF